MRLMMCFDLIDGYKAPNYSCRFFNYLSHFFSQPGKHCLNYARQLLSQSAQFPFPRQGAPSVLIWLSRMQGKPLFGVLVTSATATLLFPMMPFALLLRLQLGLLSPVMQRGLSISQTFMFHSLLLSRSLRLPPSARRLSSSPGEAPLVMTLASLHRVHSSGLGRLFRPWGRGNCCRRGRWPSPACIPSLPRLALW